MLGACMGCGAWAAPAVNSCATDYHEVPQEYTVVEVMLDVDALDLMLTLSNHPLRAASTPDD